MSKLFTIHYACASLVPQRNSYVTAIGVCDTKTKKVVTFSMKDAQEIPNMQNTPEET